MRTIEFKVETIEVKARPRRLEKRYVKRNGRRKFVYKKPLQYTVEFLPMVHLHSIDLEKELTDAYTNAILGS